MTNLISIIRSKTRLISKILSKSDLVAIIKSKTKLTSTVRGLVAELQLPIIQSAIIDATGLTLTLTYNKALNESIVPDAIDYALSGTSSAASSLIVSGLTVVITLDATVFNSETVLIDYTSGANPLQDLAGNEAANLVNNATTNNSEQSTYPAVMDNARAWYDYLNEDNIVDGSNFVSNLVDKNSEGNDLLQALGADQPLLNASGILFDGVSEFLKALPFTLVQPTQIYIVFKQITWTIVDYILDGNTSSSGHLYQLGSSPDLQAYAGTKSGENANLPLNTYGIARILFNEASSEFIIDETTPITGDFGSRDMGGFTLGKPGGLTIRYSNMEFKGAAIFDETFNSLPTPTEEQEIYDYLKTYYSL